MFIEIVNYVSYTCYSIESVFIMKDRFSSFKDIIDNLSVYECFYNINDLLRYDFNDISLFDREEVLVSLSYLLSDCNSFELFRDVFIIGLLKSVLVLVLIVFL